MFGDTWRRTTALDSGYDNDVIYLDYQKAFDTVPHKRLLKKLKWYEFDGKLLLWIENFLTDRQMRISVNGAYADWAKITSGVRRRSVLGPFLFLLYVNGIPASVSCKMKLFADDTQIWNTIKTQSAMSLQSELDLLSKWSDECLLRFNIDKRHVMLIDRKSKAKYYLQKITKVWM